MKELKYFGFMASLLGSNSIFGYVWGTVIFVVVAIFTWLLFRNRARNRRRRMIDNRIEHFYVAEKPNGNDIALKFKKGIVFFANPGRVTKLANRLAEELQLSDNQRNLKVFVFRFQHGKRVNETEEEYITYLEECIGKQRKDHHKVMNKDEAAYLEFHHNESATKDKNVFEWAGKKL